MTDPLFRVASWITPAISEVAKAADPVLALIAEEKRLDALATAARTRGDEIFDTLPQGIRKGRVRVSFSGEHLPVAGLLARNDGFTSEAELHRWVAVHRRLATLFVRVDVRMGCLGAEGLAAEEAEFDREIGLARALAQLRAGLEEIKAIREASGCEAHYREAEDPARRAREVGNQICNKKPGYSRWRDCSARMGPRIL